MKGLIDKLRRTSIKTKLIIPFLLVVLIPMVILAVSSERLIAHKIKAEIEKALSQTLRAAWIQYYVRGEQMKYGMLQAAETVEMGLLKRDRMFLKNKLEMWKSRRPYVDIWLIVDKDRRVVARLYNDTHGDFWDVNGIVKRAIDTGAPVVATEVVPREILLRESKDLANKVIVPIVSEEGNGQKSFLYDAMTLFSVVPVKNGDVVIGAIVAGDILNNDPFVPDTLASKIPEALTAITLDNVRIATNIRATTGERALGTIVPMGILRALRETPEYRKTLPIGKVNYIMAFSPIKNHRGITIGSLSVAIPEEKFIALHRGNRQNIFATAAISVILAIIMATFVTNRLTAPLTLLARKTKEVAGGNFDVDIPVEEGETKDEVAMLAKTFKNMLEEIQARNREKEIYLKQLEEKTKELTLLNEKLQATNQELEVSLEESQSQQEELQSANEELTILNEELEKKTNELYETNMKLLEEEEELRKTRDQLQLIFHGIKDFIFLLDPHCTIIDVNSSFLKAYNLRKEEVVGKKLYSLLYGCEDVVPQCAQVTGGSQEGMHRELIKTGDKELERYVFPVFDNDGNLINRIEYIRDVTTETRLREQLMQAEKLSSLGEILSGVAHELNNPLTGVIGYCELIRESAQDEKIKKHLQKINDAAMRCKKIIENLLSFARERKIEKQFSSINQLITQTLELKAYQLRIDNIDVVLELDEYLPFTMVDPYAIQQVFLNIINNAHLAMVEKGGRGKLLIKTEHTNKGIRVIFSDTGVGIPEDIRQRIFDPFFTTREVGKGTGLGLSISYGIIKEHNGEIYVESTPGEGSTFIVELPVVLPDSLVVEKQGEEEEKKVEGRAKRVLVVDDETDLLELIDATLRSAGYDVETLPDVVLALERLREKEFDLILCDIRMPGMGGVDLYRIIEEKNPGMLKRIGFITGDIMNPQAMNFLKQKGCKYITKPFTPAELRQFVRDFLEDLERG